MNLNRQEIYIVSTGAIALLLSTHGSLILISYNTYYYPLLVDPVAIYYWFFAGVLLKLPELEQF